MSRGLFGEKLQRQSCLCYCRRGWVTSTVIILTSTHTKSGHRLGLLTLRIIHGEAERRDILEINTRTLDIFAGKVKERARRIRQLSMNILLIFLIGKDQLVDVGKREGTQPESYWHHNSGRNYTISSK